MLGGRVRRELPGLLIRSVPTGGSLIVEARVCHQHIGQSAVDSKSQGRQDAGDERLVRFCPQEAVLVRFLFEDGVSARSLDEIADPALLDAIARTFVESALAELSCEELDVVFWEDENGALKMTLRGPDDVIRLAKSVIGDRAAIPPTQH
jgi:hypothetical protein